jgi:hypothetical protein
MVMIMMLRRLAGGLAVAVTVGVMPVVPVAADASTTAPAGPTAAACCMRGSYLEAGLHGSKGYPHAGGHTAYQSWHGRRQLHVRMWNLRSLRGRVLVVYVHGVRAGSMLVTRHGDAYLNRDRGVPMCRSGQAIRVRTRNGTLVGAGTFRGHRRWGW